MATTIYIQNESPGKDKESNWMPAPKEPFYMLFRMYLPKIEVLNGQYEFPGLKRFSENFEFLCKAWERERNKKINMMKLWKKTITLITSTTKIMFLFIFVVVMSTKLLYADDTTQNTADKESKTVTKLH